VDTSGASLHKRGWRRYQGPAPLAETLAAAVVQLAGWDRRAPLLDPFCGSGTVLVEAALWAAGAAPGLARQFGFERWPGHDAARYAALRRQAQQAARPLRKVVLRGSDASAAQVAGARDNLAAAGLLDAVELEIAPVQELVPRRGWNGWVVTNPPYGERVGRRAQLEQLYAELGALLRQRCGGFTVGILSGDPKLAARLELAAERLPLCHGGLACELLRTRLP
jgi:putative N6-adenine-specific DNA methylase